MADDTESERSPPTTAKPESSHLNRLARIEVPLLYGTLCSTVLAMVLIIVAISTDYWVYLTLPSGIYRERSGGYVVNHHSGLWRICRTEYFNASDNTAAYQRTTCNLLKLFPDTEAIKRDPEVDQYILNYSRSETAFAIISLLFAVIAHLFAFYSLREPRYMFKRLAGMLLLFTALSNLVCVEVLMNSVNYERRNLLPRHPPGSTITYGFSFVLAWLSFIINALAAIVFFVCSRKRKGDKARSDKEAEENEPIHLGRI